TITLLAASSRAMEARSRSGELPSAHIDMAVSSSAISSSRCRASWRSWGVISAIWAVQHPRQPAVGDLVHAGGCRRLGGPLGRLRGAGRAVLALRAGQVVLDR